jgi:hypothetical protein
MRHQGIVIAVQILNIELFQGIETPQIIAATVQNPSGKSTSRPPIPVEVRMDRHKLVMSQTGNDGHRLIALHLADPSDQFCH